MRRKFTDEPLVTEAATQRHTATEPLVQGEARIQREGVPHLDVVEQGAITEMRINAGLDDGGQPRAKARCCSRARSSNTWPSKTSTVMTAAASK